MSGPESSSGLPTDLDSLLSLRTPEPASDPAAPPGTAEGGAATGPGDANETALGELRELPVTSIVANEYQPRYRFDEDALDALTDSVRALGVLQPVLVRPLGGDRYELVAGERRWRAARRAGLGTVPAIVRTAVDVESLEQAIVENLHREDLTALEEALAYQQLVDDFGLTQDEVAGRVGRSRSAVSNTLRLLQLPPAVQRMIGEGEISAGHARAVLALPDTQQQVRLAERVAAEDLSVRATEEAVRELQAGDGADGPGGDLGGEPRGGAGGADDAPRSKSAAALEVERLLGEKLATKVEVNEATGNGRITIRFADHDDLDRIYHLLSE